jgi:hypothetical protein
MQLSIGGIPWMGAGVPKLFYGPGGRFLKKERIVKNSKKHQIWMEQSFTRVKEQGSFTS